MFGDPDRELVRRSKAGDRAAFGRLADRYYSMVYGLAYGILTEREAARDVAQTVFLKVFGDIQGFDERAKFKTWLYRVAVNAAIDEQRRQRPTVSMDEVDEEEGRPLPSAVLRDRGPSPRDEAARAETRERLRRAIEKLSAEQRAVLTLREWQGLSYGEIAETLGIEIGTVMSRLFYARRKLREWLAEEEGKLP